MSGHFPVSTCSTIRRGDLRGRPNIVLRCCFLIFSSTRRGGFLCVFGPGGPLGAKLLLPGPPPPLPLPPAPPKDADPNRLAQTKICSSLLCGQALNPNGSLRFTGSLSA